MPRRRSTRRVDASAVQGEDAWVDLRYLRWGEYHEAQTWAKDGNDSDELDRKVLLDHVIAWNWSDEDGEPLPQPDQGGEWMASLTTDEASFLIEAVFGAKDEVPN